MFLKIGPWCQFCGVLLKSGLIKYVSRDDWTEVVRWLATASQSSLDNRLTTSEDIEALNTLYEHNHALLVINFRGLATQSCPRKWLFSPDWSPFLTAITTWLRDWQQTPLEQEKIMTILWFKPCPLSPQIRSLHSSIPTRPDTSDPLTPRPDQLDQEEDTCRYTEAHSTALHSWPDPAVWQCGWKRRLNQRLIEEH